MATNIGEFLINLDTDKRIRIWIDDSLTPTDTGTFKLWLKPTLGVLLVYNEDSRGYVQVTQTDSIIASPVRPPNLEEGKLWLDESTSPATLKKLVGEVLVPVPIGDIIIGNGGNATLQKVQFDQEFEFFDNIEHVLDIPNLLLTKKLVIGKISVHNLSETHQCTIYFRNKITDQTLDQVNLYAQEFIAFEYTDTYPVVLYGFGLFRLIFEGYVLN